ncbi:pro-opiomelanocortin-like isoform X1 [Leuresthes tenuis]|uniref:pro-opiomelanocortin-like isoform X1 n=1 Tax=Leuresthes tenuis TaxID=355514 RepID=UPI003B513456
MMCLCRFVVVVMAFMCVPGFGSMCLDSSICNNLSSEERILDCVHFCMSVIQTEIPEPGASAQQLNHDDDDLLLNIILATLASEDKLSDMSESDLKAHSDKRRSYSMEHFRWGKPSGRKRRPVKVFASSLEGGDSSEGSFPFRARRHLSSGKDEAKVAVQKRSNQNEGLLMSRVSSRAHAAANQQERKDGTYRMSHFRWGSPPASKRNGSLIKLREEKPQGQLAKFLKNIIVKDVQRIIG